jgi:hypothetical protein
MTRRLLATAVLLALLIPARGAPAAPDLTPEQRALVFGKPGAVSVKGPVARIRLEGTDHRGFYKCSYMHVFINGHGPFTFLFDTGASFTAISSDVIRAARLRVEVDRGGYHDLVRVKQMKIGDVEIQDLVSVRDDDFGVDGVLGFRAFDDKNLVFELADRQLLVSSEPMPLAGSFEVPYQLEHNVPTIPLTVGAAQVAMLIDTGDDAYAWEVRTEDLKGASLEHPPLPADTVMNGLKSSQTFVSTLASSVRLGPLGIEHAVVGINDALQLPDFGVEYLREFNFEIEPARMVVTFQPLASGRGTTIRGNMSPGFTLKFDDRGTVRGVVPGSFAEARGMRSGDRVLGINGRSIRSVNPRNWDQALTSGRPLVVRWLQGTNERTDDFAVTELK